MSDEVTKYIIVLTASILLLFIAGSAALLIWMTTH